jgi:hypothetical protein
LDACPPSTRDAFILDLRTAETARQSCVTPKRATEKDGHWRVWEGYCDSLGIGPYLQEVPEQLPLLQVFAVRLRAGILSPSRKPLSARRVEDYLCTVGEEIASLGAPNPRLDVAGNVVQPIRQLQRAWKTDDPPPVRVKPVPLALARHAVNSQDPSDPFQAAVRDLLLIGYFYLLRPGEHAYSGPNGHPFRLCDTSFEVPGAAAINGASIDDASLSSAIRVNLNFTTQKNGERNESITHGDTGDPLLSPVQAVRRRVQHLRLHHASPHTPLFTVCYPTGRRAKVTCNHLTVALRTSCRHIGASLGITESDISARALRAGGAMALLRADVDPTVVQLMGRWQSDTMIRYLHRSTLDTSDLSARMLTGGNFVIPQHQHLPADVAHLLGPL